ncbi:MAG: GGDEF domain-containing protein [Sedimenticola sp.]
MEAFKKNAIQPPDYLERTTKGISIVTILLVIPFAVYSYLGERYLLGFACLFFIGICSIYLWTCKQGQCNRAYIAYPVTPLMIVSMSLILHKLGVIGVYWSLPASIALYFVLSAKWALISNLFLISVVTTVAWTVMDAHLVARYIAVLIGVNIFSAISVNVINKQQVLLKEKAVSDPLTKLYNRSLLQKALEHAKHQHNRTGVAMSLITMDLDHFKSINDDLGHDAGDRVLKSFSKLVKKSFRGTDMIFRTGGEEFLALVYNADENKAFNIAEKVRHEVEQQEFLPDRKVTVSIGVAGIPTGPDWDQWLIHCDQKLYQAKNAGRNCVIS